MKIKKYEGDIHEKKNFMFCIGSIYGTVTGDDSKRNPGTAAERRTGMDKSAFTEYIQPNE